jgi:hypothetical protein
MTMPKPSSNEPRVPESFDFELTDFEQARHALEELPPGVGSVPRINNGSWELQRRKPVATDRALSGVAMEWLVHLPLDVQPRKLAERFPRIANLIAANWSDRARSVAGLDSLIADRRGGRRGFPMEVESELRGLRQYLDRFQPR